MRLFNQTGNNEEISAKMLLALSKVKEIAEDAEAFNTQASHKAELAQQCRHHSGPKEYDGLYFMAWAQSQRLEAMYLQNKAVLTALVSITAYLAAKERGD